MPTEPPADGAPPASAPQASLPRWLTDDEQRAWRAYIQPHQISRMESRGSGQIIRQVAPHHVASVRRHFIDQLAGDGLTALTEACEPVVDRLRITRDRD